MTQLRPAVLIMLVTIAVATLAACGSDEPTPTPDPTATSTPSTLVELHPAYAEPFEMRLPRNSAIIDAEGYRIDFKSVLADNRCPVGAECLVPNVAIVELDIVESSGSPAAARQLFFDSGPSVVAVGEYDIQLLALEPQAGQAATPSDYRVTMLVTRRAAQADAELDLTVSATAAKVGELVEVVARMPETTHTQYTLIIEGLVGSIVRRDGNQLRGSQTPILDVSDLDVDVGTVTWSIVGTEPGEFRFVVMVAGQVGGSGGQTQFVRATQRFTLSFN
jgi:hypothetical protein